MVRLIDLMTRQVGRAGDLGGTDLQLGDRCGHLIGLALLSLDPRHRLLTDAGGVACLADQMVGAGADLLEQVIAIFG